MTVFANILIFHPSAIGDVMLATPVAKALRENYPGAKITFWGHSSLRQLLLGFCPYIDEYIDYDKKIGFISLLKNFWSVDCDLFVDLSNSTKGMFISAFANARMRILAYKKQAAEAENKIHAVENFLQTVMPICSQISQPLFPTIFPQALAAEVSENILEQKENKLLIGIVPGVGKHRPHRAWINDGWVYLLNALAEKENCIPVLIGGQDEIGIGEKLETDFNGKCINLIGKLDLAHTAAILQQCAIVISGDTGPAHLATAVGTKVIGLYGPTYPQRSGPYGCADLTIDQSSSCHCHGLKFCRYSNEGEPGQCMYRIMLPEVLEKLNSALTCLIE